MWLGPERILILNTDTSVFPHTDTDTYLVFFRLNTDTSVFENHTGYWILVSSFCTGQVYIINEVKNIKAVGYIGGRMVFVECH